MSQLIVVKEPGKAPEKRTVDKVELSVMKEIVGGSIELVYLPGTKLDLYLNANGKHEGLEPNVFLLDPQLKLPVDVIVGTILVCKVDHDLYNIGLTEEEAEVAIRTLEHLSLFVRRNGPDAGNENSN